MINDNHNLLTLLEAAKLTGYRADNLRQLANRGSIPAIKLGRDWFIAEEDIKALKERRTKYQHRSHPKPLFKEDHADTTTSHDK